MSGVWHVCRRFARGLICAAALVAPTYPAVGAIDIIEGNINVAGEQWPVERGVLRAPLLYAQPERGSIDVPFLRFRATAKTTAQPIFLLAGGPGNTYLDDLDGDAEFAIWLRAFLTRSDVILLEQRGSDTTPSALRCELETGFSAAKPVTEKAYQQTLAREFARCASQHRLAGVPLEAYTIREMARDFHKLREQLGYASMSLMGGSFGSQLGFAITRENPAAVARTIFYGVEGPGDTMDSPRLVDEHLNRVSEALGQSAQFRWLVGDFRKALRAELDELARAPLRGSVVGDNGSKIPVSVGEFDMKLLLWNAQGVTGYRDRIADIGRLMMVTSLGVDRFLLEAKYKLAEYMGASAPMSVNLMPLLVDCASMPAGTPGPFIDDEQYLLGSETVDIITRVSCEAIAQPRLPARWTTPLYASTPMLFVLGDLDGFAPPAYGLAAAKTLENARVLNVRYGDHGGWAALESSPDLMASAVAFLHGEVALSVFPQTLQLSPLNPQLMPTWVLLSAIVLALAAIGLWLWRRIEP